MRVVWKFEISGRYDCTVEMPALHSVVAGRVQPGKNTIALWALCDADRPLVTKTFMVLPTGATYDREDEQVVQYLCTVFDEELVWHVFEVLGVKCPGPQ